MVELTSMLPSTDELLAFIGLADKMMGLTTVPAEI